MWSRQQFWHQLPRAAGIASRLKQQWYQKSWKRCFPWNICLRSVLPWLFVTHDALRAPGGRWAQPGAGDRRVRIGHRGTAAAAAPGIALLLPPLHAFSLCFLDQTSSPSSFCMSSLSWKSSSTATASTSSGLCYPSSSASLSSFNLLSCIFSSCSTSTTNSSLSQCSCSNTTASPCNTPAYIPSHPCNSTSSTEATSS